MVLKQISSIECMLFISEGTVRRFAERILGIGHVHPFKGRNGCYSEVSDYN